MWFRARPIRRSYALSRVPFLLSPFSYYPGRHATIILHDRRLQRIHQHCVHLLCQTKKDLFIDQEPLRSVANDKYVGSHLFEVHADPRTKTAEQHSARLEYSPELTQHRPEMPIVAGKVEH